VVIGLQGEDYVFKIPATESFFKLGEEDMWFD